MCARIYVCLFVYCVYFLYKDLLSSEISIDGGVEQRLEVNIEY